MNKTKKKKKNRIWELDFLRGFAIIMVVWDHTMVSFSIFRYNWFTMGVDWLVKLGEFGDDYLFSYLRLFWRPVFLFIFFFISGLCTAFSKNNLWRGIKLAIVAGLVSLFTYILSELTGDYYFIMFGVLHCMAVIIIIYSLFALLVSGVVKLFSYLAKKQYNEKITKILLSTFCIALGIVFYIIHEKYNISLYETEPARMFIDTDNKWLGMFLTTRNWSTADYFPLFPYISYFFLGAGFTNILYPKKKSLFPSIDGKWHYPVTIAGKYSLLIYLLCQVVVFAILILITYIATGQFLL